MRFRLKYKMLLVVLLSILCLQMCSALPASPTRFQYKFKLGESTRYKFVLTTTGTVEGEANASFPLNAKMIVVLNQKTLEVTPDGSGKLQIFIETVKMSMPGLAEPMSLGEFEPITMLMSKTGQAKIISAPGGAGGLPGLSSQFPTGGVIGGAVLPANPVSVGQSWTEVLEKPSTGKALYKLVSNNVKVGKETASKIAYSVSGKLGSEAAATQAGVMAPGVGKIDDIPFDGKFAVYFSPKIGKLLRTDGTMNMKMTLNPSKNQSGKSTGKPTKVNLKMNMEMFRLP